MKYHTKNRRTPAQGFTLLEMVIVLGIIALILGGAISIMGKVDSGAKIQRVEGDFSAISSALKMYKINNGFYPTTQQGIKALTERPTTTPIPRRWSKLAGRVPLDPWNREYGYKFPGSKDPSEFEIICLGEDGKDGSEDDMSSQDPK
jgi:general secretion pathway protein G